MAMGTVALVYCNRGWRLVRLQLGEADTKALYGHFADVGQGQNVVDEAERGVLSVKQCDWLLM